MFGLLGPKSPRKPRARMTIDLDQKAHDNLIQLGKSLKKTPTETVCMALALLLFVQTKKGEGFKAVLENPAENEADIEIQFD